MEIQRSFSEHSNWSYCFGIDLGLLRGRQEFYDETGKYSITEVSETGRPRFEVEYSIPRSNFALRSGVGYLLPIGNIIRFTGTTLNTSIVFRMPLFGGPI
jgi:hypothetical protein